MRFCLAGAVVAALTSPLSLSIGAAYAGEKTLDFQLLVKYFEPRTLEAKNIEDQTLTQSKGFGVAVFKDGRIGTLDFIMTMDKQKDTLTASGYGTYTFDDGSITERFTLTGGPQGVHGDYKILSGTAAYAGATGSGSIDSAPNPYTADRLYNATLRVMTPAATH